jgi:S-adenosylmethionine:tRNA ribosyltransferase-isomerase
MDKIYEELLASYDYSFPQELIAKQPAHPRDSARLLIFDRKNDSVTFDTFANIDSYLPTDAVLVMNQTKVIPAKMTLKKITGGVISALLLSVQPETVTVLASGTLKPNDKLIWQGGHSFTVIHRNNQEALLKPSFPFTQLRELLETYGETPLPPYMKDSPLTEEQRRNEYQTIFAKEPGSVAAPTAGLHFTKELIKKIEHSGRPISYISLHVGLGTFAQVTEDQVKNKKLHLEYYSIDPITAAQLTESKKAGKSIIAVGTTTVRTLESATLSNDVRTPIGSTDLFITETYQPHFVDGLITNFHVPRSSLLMLVSAFTGREKLLEIYRQAIEERMRLFSFGDAMLIL